MRKIFVILLSSFFFINYALAEERMSVETTIQEEHNGNSLLIECNDENKPCTIKVKNAQNKTAIFHTEIFVPRTGVIWHEDNLVELAQSFGTNLSYSKFIDMKEMKLSKDVFPGVVAVDPERHLVAFCDGYLVLVDDLFDKNFKLITIARPYAGTTETAVCREFSHFTTNGELLLDYTTKINGEYGGKTELINLSHPG